MRNDCSLDTTPDTHLTKNIGRVQDLPLTTPRKVAVLPSYRLTSRPQVALQPSRDPKTSSDQTPQVKVTIIKISSTTSKPIPSSTIKWSNQRTSTLSAKVRAATLAPSLKKQFKMRKRRAFSSHRREQCLRHKNWLKFLSAPAATSNLRKARNSSTKSETRR